MARVFQRCGRPDQSALSSPDVDVRVKVVPFGEGSAPIASAVALRFSAVDLLRLGQIDISPDGTALPGGAPPIFDFDDEGFFLRFHDHPVSIIG